MKAIGNFTLAVLCTGILSPAAFAEDCSTLRGKAQHDCALRAASAQKREHTAQKRAASRRPNFDDEGRKFLYLKLKGIKPEVEEKTFDGDEIPSGLGLNNIIVYYKNAGDRMWISSSNSIYKVQKSGKHYGGWEGLEIRISSSKTSDRKGRKLIGKGVTFADPLTLRICAQTKFDNCFGNEITVRAVGNDESGYSIEGDPEIWLDRYVRDMDGNHPPLPYARKDEQAQKSGRSAAPASPVASAPAAPAADAPKKNEEPPAKEIAVSDLVAAWKGMKKKADPAPAADSGETGPVTIVLKGFSPAMASKLSQDMPQLKKGRFKAKISLKNHGESVWANVQGKSVDGACDEAARTCRDFDLAIEKNDMSRLTFGKPVLVRFEVVSTSGGSYWTEAVRNRAQFNTPFLLDHYDAP